MPKPRTNVRRSSTTPITAAECVRTGTGTATVRVEVEKRVTVAVVWAPVERERYVAVETDSSNDVLTLAVFVFVFVFVPEDRAVLVRVPAKLVECDVPRTVPAVLVWVAAVACFPAVDSAWCVVPLLSSLSVCQDGVRRLHEKARRDSRMCGRGRMSMSVCGVMGLVFILEVRSLEHRGGHRRCTTERKDARHGEQTEQDARDIHHRTSRADEPERTRSGCEGGGRHWAETTHSETQAHQPNL